MSTLTTPTDFHQTYLQHLTHSLRGKRNIKEIAVQVLQDAGFAVTSPTTKYGKGTSFSVENLHDDVYRVQLGTQFGSRHPKITYVDVVLQQPKSFNKWLQNRRSFPTISLASLFKLLHAKRENGVAKTLVFSIDRVLTHDPLTVVKWSYSHSTSHRLTLTVCSEQGEETHLFQLPPEESTMMQCFYKLFANYFNEQVEINTCLAYLQEQPSVAKALATRRKRMLNELIS